MADVNANIGVGINTSEALSQLKSLQRQISQFHSSIIKSSEAAAVAQRNLQKNFINSVNSIGAFSAELRTVRTSAESFTNSLEKNKFSMREYFRYSAASTKTFGKNFAAEFNTIEKVAVERVKTLQTQYIKMGRDAQGAMQAIAVRPAILNMQDLGTQTAIAAQKQVLFNQLLKQGSTNLLNFGKNTQWAGRQLMVGFTLPLITLGTVAAKTFMEMEAQVIKFRKVYGDLFTPDAERAKALEEIQALAKAFTQYGIAAADTVGVAAEAAAAGFSGVDLQRQTEQSLRLSVLGQIDYQKSLETTISLQNSFRLSSADLAESIDFLNAVENQTVVSLDDITTAIPKVAPVIQSLGGDVKDLAFFMAAMKEGGINASEGANALKSGLASLINPSEKSAAFLASLGINLKGIVEANPNDVKGVVIGFAQALDKLEPTKRAQAIEQLFGKFQFARLSTLFDNVIRDGTQASRVLDLAGASIDELASMSEKELGVTAESAMNKFLKTVEDLKIALAPIGEVFLQVVTPFVEMISDIAEGFNRLPEGIQKGIAATVAIVGGLGPVVLMTFGLLANGIANAIKFVAMLRNGYLGLTGQTDLLSEQTQYMTMEQLEAAAAAASLDQSHSKLIQTFNVEAGAVSKLTQAYQQAMAAGSKFAAMNPNLIAPVAKSAAKFASGGVVGGSGNKDTVAAMLTPGEFVVKKDVAQQMIPFLEALNSGKLPGFNQGGQVTAGGAQYNVSGSQKIVSDIQSFVTAIEKGTIKISNADEVLARTMKEVSESPKVYMKTFYQRLAVAADEIAEQSVANQVNKFYQNEMGRSGKAMSYSASGVGTIEQQMAAAGRSDELKRAKMRLEAEAKLDLPGQLQIDRAHRIDVGRSGKAFPKVAFREEAFNPQTHSENAISNALAGENSVSGFFEMYSQNLKGLLDEGAIKQEQFNSIMDKAKNNLALSEEELLVQSQVLDKITTSQKEFLTKNQSLSNDIQRAKAGAAVPGALLPGAGEVSSEVASKLKADLEQVKKGVVQGIKEATKQASPSKEAYEAGANIGKGAIQGIESTVDDAQVAGQQVGTATQSGKPRRANTGGENLVYDAKASGYKTESKMAAQEASRQVGMQRALTASISGTISKVNEFAGKAQTAGFAIAGIAGALTMFGGPIGEIAGIILQVTLAFSALATVTSALTAAKVAEKASAIGANVLSLAKSRGGAGFSAAGIGTAVTSVTGPLGKLASFLLRAVPWVGAALLAFEAFKFVGSIIEEQKKKITGLGDTAFLAAEKMKKAGELLGFTPAGAVNLSAGITQVKGVEGAELSKAQEIQQSENFTTDFADQINAIKGSTLAEAESALNSMIIQLIASGSNPEAAQALATAIATEAGKTDVDLSFGVKFDPTDAASLQSIATTAKANASAYNQAFEAAYVPPKTIETYRGTMTTAAVLPEKLKQQAATLGGEVSTAITALKAGLDQGTLSATEFQSQISVITGNLRDLDPAALGLVLPTVAKNLGVEEQLSGLKDLESQLVVIEALLVGVEVPQATIDRMAELSKSADPKDQAELLRIQQGLVKSTNAEVAALEQRATAKQADLQSDIEAAEYREGLDDLDARIQALQNEATAYAILTENGFSAADATAAVADANFAAALAAATNAVEQQALLDKYREFKALEAASPTVVSRGGGAGKKSDFQEAVDGLQSQRDEIKNNIAAYNKLRDAGMGVKAAFEAASDPQIAAALAKTKPGTDQWEKLIKLIKQTNAAAKELEQLELNIKVQTDFDGFLDDMISKANEYYDILERNIDQSFRDRIKKEEEAIEKAEKEISKLQEDVAKKERTIELTYDRPIAVLQEESSDLSNDLTIMDQKAKAINEKYDAQAKALEDVKKINQDIINQQKSQISLADALSQGDISAAAGLMQDMRAQSAAAASGSISNALDAARQGELGGLTNARGMTRDQIEQRQYEIGQLIYDLEEKKEVILGEIRDLQDKIYNIEVGSLKTARDKLQALEDEKQAQIDVLEAQRQKWNDAKLAADNARIKAGEFNDVLELGKLLVGDIKSRWDEIKSKMITLTIREVRETSAGGSGGGAGGGGTSTRSTTTTNNQGSQTGASAVEKQAAAAALAAGRPLTEAQKAILGLPPSDAARQAAVSALAAGKPLTEAQKKILGMQSKKYGGVVKKMANGGIVGGTGMGDVVPTMLTPGEFVVNKASSKQFMPMLKSMNDGKFPGSMKNRMAPAPMSPPSVNFRVNASNSPLPMPTAPAQNWNRLSAPATMSAPSIPRATSIPSGSGAAPITSTDASNTVYNYNLSVSVKGGSNSNPDAIANTVIAKIKQMDSQRIRGKVIS